METYIAALAPIAKKHGMYLAAGGHAIPKDYNDSVYHKVSDANNQIGYNTAVLVDRQGEYVGEYHKQFPVGSPGDGWPGRAGTAVFDLDFGRVAMLTCFDMNVRAPLPPPAPSPTRLPVCVHTCAQTHSYILSPELCDHRRSTFLLVYRSCKRQVSAYVSESLCLCVSVSLCVCVSYIAFANVSSRKPGSQPTRKTLTSCSGHLRTGVG